MFSLSSYLHSIWNSQDAIHNTNMTETTQPPSAPVKRLTLRPEEASQQLQSPLFSVLPPEIRSHIFEFALTEVEDLDNAYPMDECYRRPGHLAPRRQYNDLLQTCQRVYTECWYMPWTLSRHTFFLAWHSRSPPTTTSRDEMQNILNYIHTLDAKEDGHLDEEEDESGSSTLNKSIGDIEVYAQLCNLEGGNTLQALLNMQYFHPRNITITVRHTDFWYWEKDRKLNVGSTWVNKCVFPNSVQNVHFQLESLKRKKAHIDELAQQAARNWQFVRKDGVALLGNPQNGLKQEEWTGTSTWEDQRWVRDEARPEEIDYYIVTVTFSPQPQTRGEFYQRKENYKAQALSIPDYFDLRVCASNWRGRPYISLWDLDDAKVPRGTIREHARVMVRQRKAEQEEQRRLKEVQRQAGRRSRGWPTPWRQ